MKRRNALIGLSAVLALSLVVPALGGPSNPIAEKALSLSKVNKTAKRAQRTADSAQSAANSAQGTAANALGVANGKQDKIRWALVKFDGTVLTSSGGIGAGGSNPYIVDFGSSQLNHALLVTPLHSNVAPGGQATASICGGTGNPGGVACSSGNDVNHVIVETFNDTAADAQRSFWIASIP